MGYDLLLAVYRRLRNRMMRFTWSIDTDAIRLGCQTGLPLENDDDPVFFTNGSGFHKFRLW
jgi:hypothetical protein